MYYVVLTYELLSKYICSTKRIHIGLFPKHWLSGQAAGWPGRGAGAVHCNAAAAGLALAAQDSFILFYRLVYARRACAAVHCGALRHGGGSREDKAHYAQSAKLQLKPLTEEGALAGTTHRKRRWRRRAALRHYRPSSPDCPTRHVVQNFNGVY